MAPRMTRKDFAAWLLSSRVDIYVDGPYGVAPCSCGDLNCKGWKVIPAPTPPLPHVGRRAGVKAEARP